MQCGKCGQDVPDLLVRCQVCDFFIGYPNVREADKIEAKQALDERYQNAYEEACKKGTDSVLKDFEKKIKDSCAVINMKLDPLKAFVTDNKQIYSTYTLQVRGETRIPAMFGDDKIRKTIEAMMFGSYGENIRYAALSLNGKGLESYGPYSIKIRNVAINERATLLEENSYFFIEKHKVPPMGRIPKGFQSLWEDKYKLAVSKLECRIRLDTTEDEYATILLSSDGSRTNDDFMEIHIYGGFTNGAIDAVRCKSANLQKNEKALVKIMKETLKDSWIEE